MDLSEEVRYLRKKMFMAASVTWTWMKSYSVTACWLYDYGVKIETWIHIYMQFHSNMMILSYLH